MKKKELQSELERFGVAFKPSEPKFALEKKLKKAEKKLEELNPASTFGALPGTEELPEVVSSEEPAIEEPVEVEAPVEAAVEVKEELGFLGGLKIKITALSKETLNGREYNRVALADGTTMLLNDHDLEVQRS